MLIKKPSPRLWKGQLCLHMERQPLLIEQRNIAWPELDFVAEYCGALSNFYAFLGNYNLVALVMCKNKGFIKLHSLYHNVLKGTKQKEKSSGPSVYSG